jgi:endo-1,4-beta-D-glucanase Y
MYSRQRPLYVFLLLILLPAFPGTAHRIPVPPSSSSSRPVPIRPFPQHVSYHEGSILPDSIGQAALDDSVRSFYRQWKQRYVLTGCHSDEKYVWFEGTSGTNQNVSEGQGYGMLIVALMAGYDPDAKETFDDLFRYYKAHPCRTSPYLMAWQQDKHCRSTDGSSATDGDLDIAYSLLLADAQWGSGDSIPYRQDALDMILAIRQQEINHVVYNILLSNDDNSRSKDFFDTRSSDFMPDHLRAFREASGDPCWDTVLDNTYRLFQYLQDTYSPEAGLVPDFIRKIRKGPAGGIQAVPAQPHYLESLYDGAYNFNACRVPWRIATDYLLYGDQRSAAFVQKINHWIRWTTKDNPDNISAGYNLAGEDMRQRNYEALCFIAPFAVAAMTNKDNQPWLNAVWGYLTRFPMHGFDYYDNSIKMIDMIILSGNYWAPGS